MVVRRETSSLVLLKRAPHSDSDADAMTLRIMVEVFKIHSLLFMVGRIDAMLPRYKCPPSRLHALASELYEASL